MAHINTHVNSRHFWGLTLTTSSLTLTLTCNTNFAQTLTTDLQISFFPVGDGFCLFLVWICPQKWPWPVWSLTSLYVWTSRVHISQSTLECLHGEFDVEPGNGGDRCDYLRERGIETYLVVVPKGPLGKNGISGVVSLTCYTHTEQIFGYSNAGLKFSQLICSKVMTCKM